MSFPSRCPSGVLPGSHASDHVRCTDVLLEALATSMAEMTQPSDTCRLRQVSEGKWVDPDRED
jgi:hypothetical protein